MAFRRRTKTFVRFSDGEKPPTRFRKNTIVSPSPHPPAASDTVRWFKSANCTDLFVCPVRVR